MSTHWIFSFDQNVVHCLSWVSIDILRDTQLSSLWVDLEERVMVLPVKAVRQRVEQVAKLWAVCICGNDLKRRKTSWLQTPHCCQIKKYTYEPKGKKQQILLIWILYVADEMSLFFPTNLFYVGLCNDFGQVLFIVLLFFNHNTFFPSVFVFPFIYIKWACWPHLLYIYTPYTYSTYTRTPTYTYRMVLLPKPT